jgi:carboxyl-terminal processing protease
VSGRIAAAAVAAVLGALILGIYLGGHPSSLPQPVRDSLVDESTSVQSEAARLIGDYYYKEIPRSELRDASVRGMVRALKSRFSHYFTPRENAVFKESTSGEFSGVGMTVVERKRGLLVAGVFNGSPAKRVGIKPGDLIVAVDGKPIAGEPSDVAVARIKGKPGTSVRLTVAGEGGRRRQVTVRRQRIRVPVAAGRMVEVGGRKLGVVRLASFTSGAHAELARQIQRLQRRGADGFVLDLRGNGGGLLDEAVLVSSLWVPGGKIVTTEGRRFPRRVIDATGDTVTRKPVVVLVDRNTASASEIVTAALKERLGAPVVGLRTFGKGVFGDVFELSNGGALNLVVGNYYTPQGHNLNGRGVKPDVRAVDNFKTRADEALDRALAELEGRIDRTGGG